jgi:hypothetical protein
MNFDSSIYSSYLYDEDVDMVQQFIPAKKKVQDKILAQPKVQGSSTNQQL